MEEIIADNRYSPELDLTLMGLIDQDMKIVADDAIRTTTVCNYILSTEILACLAMISDDSSSHFGK